MYNPTERYKKILSSKIFIFIILVLIGFVSFAIVKETMNKHKVEQEINDLEAKIEKIKGEGEELTEAMAYLNTKSYEELEKRRRENLAKPGEEVTVLNNVDYVYNQNEEEADSIIENNEEGEVAGKTASKSNPELWFDLFFK